jgi:hypothetical protein
MHRAMELLNIPVPRPLNIPEALMKPEYLKRSITYQHNSNLDMTSPAFIKNVDIVKGFVGETPTNEVIPEGNYLVSELVPIDAEYRCFVMDGKILDVRRYSGNYLSPVPDYPLLKSMVKDFRDAPPAWTLDVGVSEERGTFIIECHHFYSIGLYGCNLTLLSFMFKQWWNWNRTRQANV